MTTRCRSATMNCKEGDDEREIEEVIARKHDQPATFWHLRGRRQKQHALCRCGFERFCDAIDSILIWFSVSLMCTSMHACMELT